MQGLRMLVAAWTLVLAGGVVPAHAAVTDYLGKSIVSVRVVVEGRDTSDTSVLRVIETRVGQPLSMTLVRESITHLFSLGRFEDVRVDADTAAGGVVLRYDLRPIHPVSKIVFDGKLDAPGIDQGRLRRAIVERAKATPSVGRAADLAQTISAALAERGYLHASVTPRTDVSHATERTTLVFTIDPGGRTLVGAVEIAGTPSVPRAQFLDKLGLVPGTPYQAAELGARIDRYIAEQRSHGYYEAKVTPAVQLVEGDHLANVTLTVAHGPHVRVVFAGDPLPADRRADLVPVEREGSVDEDLLEDATRGIEDFLKTQGYRDATASHSRQPSGDELLISFDVKKGPQYRVSRVEISGNASVPISEFSLRLRTGLPFSAVALDADVATIEGVYRAAGFAGAKADSALEPEPSTPGAAQVPVLVRIAIREGTRTTVGAVRFSGNRAVSEATLGEGLELVADGPLVVARLAADRDQVQLRYANLGFANASVDVKPEFTRDGTRADIVYTIREGPQILVDHVMIVGNAQISTATIERELQLRPGDPLGRDAVYESQLRLYGLGLFRRVTIQELQHGEETRRDLLVTVEEGPTTTVAFGGGIEAQPRVFSNPDVGGAADERIDFAPRASFEITRRNLFGKNRSVTAFASAAVLFKKSTFTQSDSLPSEPRDVRTDYRLFTTFREPRVFNTGADLSLTATTQQQIRSSFGFTQRSAGIDVGRKVTRTWSVNGGYQIQRTETFNIQSESEQLLIDRVFPKVRLSSFSMFIVRDTRNDQLDPSAGELFSANGQLAGRRIGSQVGFVKSFFTGQMFRTLPHANRIVFAGRALLGLATGFPQESPVTSEVSRDLPESERFYAGGDTTVRGFALDALGIRHDPPQPEVDTLDSKGFARGGNAEVIFNAELRVRVRGGLGVVPFVDVGNVFRRVTQMDLGELRTAVGFGLRYKSPVGPIRIDLGFKVNRQPVEHLTAWFVTFGQAF